MKPVRESAEHHFLTMLEKLKDGAQGWYALYFSLSKKLPHEQVIKSPGDIATRISKAKAQAELFFDDLMKKALDIKTGYVYLFPDTDIIVIAKGVNEAEQRAISDLYTAMSANLPENFSDRGDLTKELYNYTKLADQKLLSAQRFTSYDVMCDAHKISSIAVRRSRRDDPKVLVVEDDRFTASYTANILSKDYDLVMCRTGEEGIEAYIEHAPDIVFLDIHLPGLNGHETLQAIKAVDPDAFIVMLSVDTAKTSIIQASQGGARNFLKKPFSKERLINTVKSSPFVRGHNSSDGESIH